MNYQALYRKFRPREFSEVKGQDHIVTTLKNEIKAGRIGHAYLFTGTRGTGKTTVARIFAKAVNCENPKEDGSPCGECPICRSIDEGNSLNVIEIDAASHNKVEDVREIVEEVEYAPTAGRYKVYILDEAHMMTPQAFDALLKTLEEPPEHVIFILATTEVHKMKITILSRCQRHDFHRISIATITENLKDLMDQEGITIEERGLSFIAKKADGSMRDALSLLDRCINFYMGQEISYDDVLNVLGAVDTEIFSRFLRGIHDKNAGGVIRLLDEIVVEGRELSQFISDFIWYLRNLLLLKSSEDMEDVLDLSTENLATLKEESGLVGDHQIMRYIRVLSELTNQMRFSTQKRVLLEIALLKLMRPQMETDVDAILDRVEGIEEKLESGAYAVAAAPAAGAGNGTAGSPAPANMPVKKELPPAVSEDLKKAAANWKQIAADAALPLKTFLKNAYVSVSEKNELLLVFDESDKEQSTSRQYLEQEGKKEEIEALISAHIDAAVTVRIVKNEAKTSRDRTYPDAIAAFAKEIDMEIVEEDF